MEARQLLEALHVAERLKDETRHCTTTKGAPRKRRQSQLAYGADGVFYDGRVSGARHE